MFKPTNSNISHGGPAERQFLERVNVQLPYSNTSKLSYPTSYSCITHFMGVMEQEVPASPKWPDEETYRLRLRLMLEEDFETYKAFHDGDAVEILDGLVDKDYVATGTAAAFGFNYEAAFIECHNSNLSKLDPETGKPNKDEYGKVIKPPTYRKANFAQFVPPEMQGALGKPPYDTRKIVVEELTKILEKHRSIFQRTYQEIFGERTTETVEKAPEDDLDYTSTPHMRV